MEPLRAVKGMADMLPAVAPHWTAVERAFFEVTARYGFGEVRTPILEPTDLFRRSIGEATDIVEKEMYTFVDKGDATLSLRPEGTAAAARAYIQHKIYADQPVTKWCYVGPMYRRERPAKGRFRQFTQLGVEVFGDPGPHIDAEVIAMLVHFLEIIGIRSARVVMNSLGSAETRAAYRKALLDFLSPQREKLSQESQARLERSPLRVLDSKDKGDQAIAAQAPSLLEFLGPEDQAHFDTVKRQLEALGVPFTVDPTLVRGLDYYNRTLFEVKVDDADLGAQNTLCGGGRYDTLVTALGGPETPAVGFAVGLERLLVAGATLPDTAGLDAWVATSAPEQREAALTLMQGLRHSGLRCDGDFRGNSLKSQLRRANKEGAAFAVICGEEEAARGAVTLRNLQKAEQEEVPTAELLSRIQSAGGAA